VIGKQLGVIVLATVLTPFLLCLGGNETNQVSGAVQGGAGKTNLVGEMAPVFVLRNTGGDFRSLGELCYAGEEKPGKPRSVVVLDFFSVDCEPCKREMSSFLKIAREFRGKRVQFFLVCVDPASRDNDLKTLMKDKEVDCEVLLDMYKVAFEKFKIKSVPRTLVIAKDRKICEDIAGAHDDFEATLRRAIEKTLSAEK